MKIVCDVLGVARSNLHVRAHRPANWVDRRRHRRICDDSELVAELTQEIAALPSYGYRRAWTMVNRRREHTGRQRVNHKRVYRVMRDYGLLLQRHTGRPLDTRGHDGRIAVSRSDRRWCSDGFEIAGDNRERVRVAFALDCCDAPPDQLIEWLTDNGSHYIARDTCSFAHEIGLEPLTTAIRSPQSNGMAEAFVKTFKRDYVERMHRSDAITVMRQLNAAFEHYNDIHPHSALNMLSPRMFRRRNAQLSVSGCPEK